MPITTNAVVVKTDLNANVIMKNPSKVETGTQQGLARQEGI
jgi:hypothetical protein